MKYILYSSLLLTLSACNRFRHEVPQLNEEPNQPVTNIINITNDNSSSDGYYSYSKYGDFKESEYTEWMAFPELQLYIDNFDSSESWILRSEGRNYKGLAQYRYAYRVKPADALKYQVRSGRNADDFKNLGIKYVRDGYEQVSLQLFKDSSGTTRHQGIWIKYKSTLSEEQY